MVRNKQLQEPGVVSIRQRGCQYWGHTQVSNILPMRSGARSQRQ